jgi:leucine dehydrogenase
MIDDALARSIDCRVVAGAANNPLTGRAVARTLMERDILYVPDFLANCGGLIHVSMEWYGNSGGDEASLIAGAMERLEIAIETAGAEGTTPVDVAERQALERVETARSR